METPADRSLARWSTPECPFTIEYVARVLDDIRLAVIDAYFSLPRGGAEIGGILLGRVEKGRIAITDAIPLECEHAFGPSFTLSENDQAHLGTKLAGVAKNGNSRPVGWYHSHTRSEIFLSEADLEIYKRFFPEPWQVALVLKPHTFLPTRAGFFFRAPDGGVRADASCLEFQLEPLPIGKVPADEPEAARFAPAPAPSAGRVIDISSAARPEPAAEPEEPSTPEPMAEPPLAEEAPMPAMAAPSFAVQEAAAPRRWLAPVAIVAGLAVGAAGFLMRQLWMPRPAAVLPTGIVTPASVGLTVTDRDGQMQIRWDAKSPDVQRSTGAMLFLSDGTLTRSVALDTAQARSGSYTYKRTTDRVEAILSLSEPGGDKLVQAAGFVKAPEAPVVAAAPVAPPPAAAPTAVDQGVRKERDALREEVADLKAANTRLTEANKRMERYIETDRAEHQRKRMENQSTGGGKL
jgi:proteasome lid subunit RPN8/RPN11